MLNVYVFGENFKHVGMTVHFWVRYNKKIEILSKLAFLKYF